MFRVLGFRLAPSTTDAAAKLPAGNPVFKSWFRQNLIIRRKGSYRSRWGTGAEGYGTGVPFSDQVKLHCVDNTNCKHVRLISRATAERFAHCRVFPAVAHRVSVQRFKQRGEVSRHRVKPGSIYWVCLFTRRQTNTRMSGLQTNFDRNTCIIMNDSRVPLGSRVMYCAGRHVNHKYHLKAVVLANFFV
ncbi:large subunit ribosomal protein L14 [Strigomonas culicis]|uniref:Large subunit ribosomal protein L14 n=1 Tax=Strigomonas culicis TaxID=28005 RepID=S9VZR8_9TRYP|nr:large subunit ribosomal protein L14 [Strigomonas culicis]EPY31899.1 large subunit ribosomal protein L14 [Strigomonas culicis]|eukprot:EPY29100.1 large subunit ribosomal protein L14 [Strigomonas culicis]